MNRFFNPDSLVWRLCSRIGDILGLSICWVFCSLPIFTLGAATTALYDSVAHCVLGEDPHSYGRFFRSFKNNFKTATLVTLLGLVVAAAFVFFQGISLAAMQAGLDWAAMFSVGYKVLFCVPLMVWLFAFAILSRFEFKALPLLKTAFLLAFAHLPSGVVILAATLVAGWLCGDIWFPVLFLPAMVAVVAGLLLERIFRPFEEQQKESETENTEETQKPSRL